MKRRTLFKTGLFAALGSLLPNILAAKEDNISKSRYFDFEYFFKVVNGFEMNQNQKNYYGVLGSKFEGMYGPRQCGMSTLLATMMFYDEVVLHKSVMLVTISQNMIHRFRRVGMIERLAKHIGRPTVYTEYLYNTIIPIKDISDSSLCGRSFDRVYIEDDAYRITSSDNYKKLQEVLYPVVRSRKDGKVFIMGTYEVKYVMYDIPAPDYTGRSTMMPKINFNYKMIS